MAQSADCGPHSAQGENAGAQRARQAVGAPLCEDPTVENRLIEQGIAYWQAPWLRDGNGNRVRRVCNVVD